MSNSKCGSCGLVNLSSDFSCRRCGHIFASSPARPPVGGQRPGRVRSLFYTLLALALVGYGGSFVYNGLMRSFNEVEANDANRIATQSKQEAELLGNRDEGDKLRADRSGNAVKDAPALAESTRHNNEIKKALNPEADKTQKESERRKQIAAQKQPADN